MVHIAGLVPLMLQLVKSEHKEHVFLGASILGEVLHHGKANTLRLRMM